MLYLNLMITLAFILTAFLIGFGIKEGYFHGKKLLFVLMAIYAASFMPSLGIPQIYDDIDHIHDLSLAVERSQVRQWILTPHNEHVIPTIKWLYYLNYRYFALDSTLLHALVIAAGMGILWLAYQLVFYLTRSPYAALLCLAFLAGNNLSDQAMFIITDSHILFCLLLFLALFYAQLRYTQDTKNTWLAVIFLAAVLLPTTFSLGLTSLFFVFLFQILCLSAPKAVNERVFFAAFIGWAISLIPFILSWDQLVMTRHYTDYKVGSTVGILDLMKSVKYFATYIYNDLLPGISNPYLAIGLFELSIFAAFKYRRVIPWEKAAFFLIFGGFLSLIIFCFRILWGALYLSVSRYDVLPVVMLVFSYAFVLSGFLMKNAHYFEAQKIQRIFLILCLILVTYGAVIRYHKAEYVFTETRATLQKFYFEFYSSIS